MASSCSSANACRGMRTRGGGKPQKCRTERARRDKLIGMRLVIRREGIQVDLEGDR
jgi:hypothetical protein